MRANPTVEEVRRVRDEIERKYGSSGQAYYRHLRRIQKAIGNCVVSRGPRRLHTSRQMDRSE